MSPRNKTQACYGTSGEGCPELPGFIYQPYITQPERRICNSHAEAVRKHYIRSKRLRKMLPLVLRPIPEVAAVVAPPVVKAAPVEPVAAQAATVPAKRNGRTGRPPGRPRAAAKREAVPA